MNSKYKNAVFVSDLDGTLLNKNAMLPESAAEHIGILVKCGIKITYATARTYYTVEKIMNNVPMPYPVALMNGVMIRDMNNRKNIKVNVIDEHQCSSIYETLMLCGVSPVIYFLDGEDLNTAYTHICGAHMTPFINERKYKYGKPVLKIDDISSIIEPVIYYTVIDEEDKVKGAYKKIKSLTQVECVCYGDSYSNAWYLEVYSDKVSKGNAAMEIKKLTGSDKLICFGDNFNDLPMFEVSDEAYSPPFAPDEVRVKSCCAIDVPELCGVTRKIGALAEIDL